VVGHRWVYNDGAMRKVTAVISLVAKDRLQYSAEVFYWLFLSLIGVFVMVYVWLAVFQGQAQVAGFTLSSISTYYFVALVIRRMSDVPSFWIAELIQQGGISAFLLRPLDFFRYSFIYTTSSRLISFLISTPVLAGVLLLLREYIITPQDWQTWVLFVAALGIAITLSALFGFVMGSVTFWITEVGSLYYFYGTLLAFLGGSMLPLSFFPPELLAVFDFLPFRFLYSFPINIYLEKIGTMELLLGLGNGILWVIIMVGFYWLLWQKGVRKYSAFGG